MRTAVVVLFAARIWAQKLDPVQWSAVAGPVADGQRTIRLTAKIDAGWHLYSFTTPRPPIATTASIDGATGLEVYQPRPRRQVDPNFGAETETFEGEAVFYLRGAIPKGAALQVRYQACTDQLCLPPRRKVISLEPGPVVTIPSGLARVVAAPATRAAPPVRPTPERNQPASAGDLAPFLGIAFGFGLAAIFTPCVFPMIPITLSFFLGQSEGRSRSQQVAQALLFCLGIIGLFTLLGVALTAVLGPFGVVQAASHPWVNGFIAAIFIALALSLLGAFEITLPSRLLTRLNASSGSGGILGTLLMGLTFSLTSFACVGPFVGTLLAASVTGGGTRPVLGMLAFASGLALPFLGLALFPSLLQKMPRAGGWMVRVKVVMGFLILAAAMKYLANVDQVMQWNFLTRERFLAAWFVLFLLPGLYLLGLLPLEGVRRDETLGVSRLLTGTLLVIFAVSLLPGMFGGRLGELDAYVPLASEERAGPASSTGMSWMKNDLAGALARARAENKRLFVNFTGYTCTNCHWMKANMFTRPEIREALGQFVLLELYTDGASPESERNQQYQEAKFHTVAIPFYAILDAEENVLASFPGLTKNPAEYLAFLRSTAPMEARAVGIAGQLLQLPN